MDRRYIGDIELSPHRDGTRLCVELLAGGCSATWTVHGVAEAIAYLRRWLAHQLAKGGVAHADHD